MIVDILKEILHSANSEYIFEYEENSMMNIKVDNYKYENGFVYIEEFTRGQYVVEKYRNFKTTRAQIWFCRFCQMQNDAIEREQIRNQIEAEIVYPFMRIFDKRSKFTKVEKWNFYTPVPRFDANEVSIMLEFDLKEEIC